MKFQVGDVVQLKSGGPAMTVSFVGEKKFAHGQVVPIVACTWFEREKVNSETFKPEMLKNIDQKA